MRPQIISIICVLGVIGVAFSVVLAIGSDMFTMEYRLWTLGMACVSLKALQGIWHMKKWGVVLYAVKLALSQVAMMMAGLWSAIDLMVPVAIMLVLSNYYGDMK